MSPTQCKEENWNRKACQRFKVKPIKLPSHTMPGLTLSERHSGSFKVCERAKCVRAHACPQMCACIHVCAAREVDLYSMEGGEALPQKSFYWMSSISVSFGPSLSERGMNRGANHTGLHSISISLCCHGSWALSRLKISHCTERGLMSEQTYEHISTHMHTHMQPLWREVTCSSCFDPVTHFSHYFSGSPPVSLSLCMAQQLCAHVHWAPIVKGVCMCESVRVRDSKRVRQLCLLQRDLLNRSLRLSTGQMCCVYLSLHPPLWFIPF